MPLDRATFRVAAISFWGLASIVMATDFIGSDLHVNYTAEWIVTSLACAAGVVCWLLPWGRIPARRFIPVVIGGVAMLTVGLFATGGIHSHLAVLFLVIVVFTASILEFPIAAAVLVLTVVAAALPLLVEGWDPSYARSLVLLAASMVICAYIPALGRKALREENQLAERRRMQLEESYLSTIEALAAALDAKDRHTEAHSRETAAFARAVGERLGLDEEALRFLEYGALLHDIGKIGIPGYILNKPGVSASSPRCLSWAAFAPSFAPSTSDGTGLATQMGSAAGRFRSRRASFTPATPSRRCRVTGPIAAPGRGTGSSRKSTRSPAGSSTQASPRRYCRRSNRGRSPSAVPPRACCTKTANQPLSITGPSISTPSSNSVRGWPPW